jgi:predicted  nucleic acid-binding Zn-ribbon protein
MKELATKLTKRVTLEVIYEAVEERTSKIESDIAELKDKQEEDFRYLSKRIDDLGGRIDSLGGRMDTMMQMLMEISKQMLELSKQK